MDPVTLTIHKTFEGELAENILKSAEKQKCSGRQAIMNDLEAFYALADKKRKAAAVNTGWRPVAQGSW